MNGLSIDSHFDGMSCGYEALRRLNLPIEKYYATEIDKHAIKISLKNHPSIIQLGDITTAKCPDHDIDLLMGGSPCQGFSIAGDGLNFEDPRSKLFFDFLRRRDKVKPKKVLLENVKMKEEWRDVITMYMGIQPILINSALVSGQRRERYYWTDIEGVTQPEDRGIQLKDILEDSVDDKYYHSEAAINYMNRTVNGGRNHWDFAHHSDTNKAKSACITANFKKGVPYNVLIDRRNVVTQMNPWHGCSTNQPKMQHRIYNTSGKCVALTTWAGRTSIFPDKEGFIRRLTPIECERLQTLPDNYTHGVSEGERYKMIGNGWNVETIMHILSFAKF